MARALDEAMVELDHAPDISELLASEQVVGDHEPQSCPVAVFVTKRLDDRWSRVLVSKEAVLLRGPFWKRWEIVRPAPRRVRAFVDDFDSDVYPGLEWLS